MTNDSKALEAHVLAAFHEFAVRDINLPHWWGKDDTARFVSKLTARLAAGYLPPDAVAGLREALRPFAEEAAELPDSCPDDETYWVDIGCDAAGCEKHELV